MYSIGKKLVLTVRNYIFYKVRLSKLFFLLIFFLKQPNCEAKNQTVPNMHWIQLKKEGLDE